MTPQQMVTETTLRAIGENVVGYVDGRCAFVLVLGTWEPGMTVYVSNAVREDAIRLLERQLAVFKGACVVPGCPGTDGDGCVHTR